MKRCNMFAKFNERRKANSQISKEGHSPGFHTCSCPSRSTLHHPAVLFPCILHLSKGIGCTQDLCAGFCFHFDLFMMKLWTELLQNVCYMPFGYITSSIYCNFCWSSIMYTDIKKIDRKSMWLSGKYLECKDFFRYIKHSLSVQCVYCISRLFPWHDDCTNWPSI